MNYHNGVRSPNDFRGGGRNRPFDSPPSSSGFRSNEGDEGGLRPIEGRDGGFRSMERGFRPIGGPGGGFRPPEGDVGFSPIDGGRGGVGSNYQVPPPLVGQKREYPFSGHGRSPDVLDSSSFAKLFVGSVPRTAAEEDIRPLFEIHGKVMEVALIKDKRTGQQQGCCFIKYATSEEADRAIRALHNQHTLPGGVGPIQVRYADGERERLENGMLCVPLVSFGAVEYKLFVGSLNKQTTEKEVEEIFSPYGRVEDVYLMRDEFKHSRGCGFVKYSDRDVALAAIKGLSGIYTMRGCDQPLIVRFADPKRPRPGDLRGPSVGGLGFGPRFEAPGARPMLNYGEPMGDQNPPSSWHLISPPALKTSLNAGVRRFEGQLPPRSGDTAPTLNLAIPQVPPGGQQVSPLQNPIQSPQNMGSSFQLNPQAPSTYSQTQTSLTAIGQFIQPHNPLSSGQPLFNQPMVPQNRLGLSAPLSINLQQPPSVGPLSNQLQQMVQPPQHSPSQLAQMLSQQTQTLKASFQSSQQTFSQLQQQLQSMQPTNQGLASQPNSKATKQQPPWAGNMPHAVSSTVPTTTTEVPPSTSGLTATPQTVAPVKCNWTEHTSPDDYKYYYNSMTGESRWEKPEEFLLFEQKQQKPLAQQPLVPLQTQVPSAQQPPQNQLAQLQVQHQLHFRQHQQLQQPSLSPLASGGPAAHQNRQEGGGYPQQFTANSGAIDPTRFQQGYQASQEWMWKNKPTGA